MQRIFQHQPETVIVAMIGNKGGITKTTTTAHLAAALAALGWRVVVVESDGQGSLTKLMGLKPEDQFYAVMAQNAEWGDALVAAGSGWQSDQGELWLLSSADGNLLLAGDPTTGNRIYERFDELRGWADFVLVDTSPAVNEINNAWFYAADWLLLPTLCERPSLDQLTENTFAYIGAAWRAAAEAGQRAAKVRGIIPNRYMPNTHAQSSNVARLQRLYGNDYRIFPVLRDKPIWNTAANLRMSITALLHDENIGVRRQAMLAETEMQPVVDSLLALQPQAVVL